MFDIEYLPGYQLREKVETFLREWLGEADFITAHTSGSTGKPKEIHLPKADMLVSAKASNRRFGLTPDSVLLCPLSPDYIAGKMMIVRALTADCRLVFCQPSTTFLQNGDVREFMDSVPGIDLLPIVPAQCKPLLIDPLLARFRNIIIGGAPLPAASENAMLRAIATLCGTETPHDDNAVGTAIFATYGMTETCSHVALRRLGSQLYEAMPGVSFELDDRECLAIVAPNYSFKRLQTNDIARLVSPAAFEWLGRFDNVINSGGVKLFPEEIEKKLEAHIPAPFIIRGIPSEKWGEETVLVCLEDNTLKDSDILTVCRNNLSPYQVPKSVIRIPAFPLTTSGKIRRNFPL